MRPLLNTLFVTSDGSYLKKEGESVTVMQGKDVKFRMPLHNLAGIICMARCSCSPSLLGLCGKKGVAVTFLTPTGRFLARLQGPVSGNVLLRTRQYRVSEELSIAVEIARSMIFAKIYNCRLSLQRACRDHHTEATPGILSGTIAKLSCYLQAAKNENNLERLRGLEGYASRLYFQSFNYLIVAQKEDFHLSSRNRRPPLDRVNALLSFVYTLLLHDVSSALETVGLDPAVGFLHRLRPGRLSLALDLMEEFRPSFADRLVLTMINLKQISGNDFEQTASGGIWLNETGRKKVIVAYQKRKQDELTHPFLSEKIPVGMCFFAQALLLARYLRGDLDAYPAFFWK